MKAPFTFAFLAALLTAPAKTPPTYWKIAADHWIYTPEVRDPDGTLYVSSYQGLQAVDEKTGHARWILPSPNHVAERVMRSGPLVLAYSFLAESGSLRAIDAQTGKQLWIANEMNGHNKPVVAGQTVWMLASAGDLLAIDATTGRSQSIAKYAGKDNVLAACGATILLGQSDAGILEGRSASGGKLLWTRKLGTDFLKPWVGCGNGIALAPTLSGVHAFRATDGQPMGTQAFHLKEPARSNFQVLDDRLFYSEANGSFHTVYALDLVANKDLWQAPGLPYLSEDRTKMVRRAGDLWVLANPAGVTLIANNGARLATVSASTASTGGSEAFASLGDFGYAVEAEPRKQKRWEIAAPSDRERSTLIQFRLRTGELTGRFQRKGVYDIAALNGRLLLVTEEGLESIVPPQSGAIDW
jgi:outer membrane protein assembly factor BamB